MKNQRVKNQNYGRSVNKINFFYVLQFPIFIHSLTHLNSAYLFIIIPFLHVEN